MSTPPAYPTPAKPQGEPPIDQPYYGAPFPAAIKRFFQKYATFSGRAGRAEYWWWILVSVVVSIVLSRIWGASHPIDVTQTATTMSLFQQSFDPISSIWSLITLVPGLALFWRRMHDTNRSGLWIFLALIPLVGAIILIVFAAQAARPEGARFDKQR